jgi:pimeloyl-ACP methyl ester carboxylesterase
VIALDHRGHGRSTKVGDVDGYSLDRLAADLAAFVAANVEGPFDLLGHSMGGVVVQKLLLDHGVAVRHLVLMDTSATDFTSADPETDTLLAGFLAGFDPARGLPGALPPSDEDALIAASTPAAWQARKDELSAGFDPYALKALGGQLLGTADPLDLLPRLAEVAVPTLVLVGELDGALVARSALIADAVPGARLVTIDGAYHSPQLTHADEWREAITTFLAED